MLIEFTVGNHLSFKDKKTLSLEASSIKEFEENTFKAVNYNLLKSAVVYGANSSGKSNLLKSFISMQSIVIKSAQMSSTDKIDVKPFLLNTETEIMPSYFEILILIGSERYRYGFEADETMIYSEWLFERTSKTERPLFYRDKNKIEVTKYFSEGIGIEEKTRENALFLSAVDQWNGKISKKIIRWFSNQIFFFSGLIHEHRRNITIEYDKQLNNEVSNFISQFNLGFNAFKFDKNNQNSVFHSLFPDVQTRHNKYDKQGKIAGEHWFDLYTQESSGTNKIFDFSGVIMAGLEIGATIIIDELDAKLHPLLTLAVVKLFNSPEHNSKNAQLIFATHDTNLLSYGAFRRDQIYFTEKNQFEETDLYSLVEYKDENGVKPRNDRSFEKDYINGRYGAIPFIGDFSNLLNNGQGSEN